MTDGSEEAMVIAGINRLQFMRHVVVDGQPIEVALLVHPEGWRPLQVGWWTGKEASIIGVDVAGNFFLRHADGSVGYWSHAKAEVVTVARSIRDFIAAIQ